MKTSIKQREFDGINELNVLVPYHKLSCQTDYYDVKSDVPASMVWVCVETARDAKDLWDLQDEWQRNQLAIWDGMICPVKEDVAA
tara:strand:- start:986 stop:1240 length:255 start_codon:yes stop_codon:yes gene_type:complete